MDARKKELIAQALRRLVTARGQIVTALRELEDAEQTVDVANLHECLLYLDEVVGEP